MADYQHLILTQDSRGVATVTLNRPDVHNAFNDAMIDELRDVFTRLGQDDSIRLTVLRGAGKSFCAGADLAAMKALKDAGEDENCRQSERLADMYTCLNALPVPLIGIIHGAALGGGTGLAAICDYVLTLPETRFGLTEVRLGIVPAVISPFVIAKIGESHARAYFLSGLPFDGEKALAIGLAHELAENTNALEDATENIIGQFLKAGPNAARMAKQLITELPAHSGNIPARNAYTCALIAKARVAEEGQEGMDAFLSKRLPGWSSDS